MQINDHETGFMDVYHPCWPIGPTSKRELWWLTRTLVDLIDSAVIRVVEKRACSPAKSLAQLITRTMFPSPRTRAQRFG